jgi:hypothetical protein
LHEALQAYEYEPDRYKQVAAELRVLVCSVKRRNRPLLLDLLDEHEVESWVYPTPGLPFPIPLVGQPYAAEQEGMREASPLTLREFVERGLAVFISGREFTYRDLVLAVAQQIGTGHEDPLVDEHLAELEQYIIGGFSGYGAPVGHLGQLALSAGLNLTEHLVQQHDYRPHWLPGPSHDPPSPDVA